MVYCLSWNIFDKELLSAASHDSDYERKTIIIISPFPEQSRFIKDIQPWPQKFAQTFIGLIT